MNYNLYEARGSFNLKAKNQTTEVGSMFIGASFPNLGHGFFPKWTKLQRFFLRLPIHLLPCVGFKLRGFFCRLFKLFYKMPRLFFEVS